MHKLHLLHCFTNETFWVPIFRIILKLSMSHALQTNIARYIQIKKECNCQHDLLLHAVFPELDRLYHINLAN
jgi:hypothetical protein